METFTGILNMYSRWEGRGASHSCSPKRGIITICSLFLSLRCYFSGTKATKGDVFPSMAWPKAFPFKLSQQFIHSGDHINLWRLVGTIAACFFVCLLAVFLLHKSLLLKAGVHTSVVFPAPVKAVLLWFWMFSFCREFHLKWLKY